MTLPDIINGCFEAGMGLMQFLNCRRLFRDKEVKGVDWRATFFAFAWGLWNLFYYPSLAQWASLTGGMLIVSANLVWLAMVWFYIQQERRFFLLKCTRDDCHDGPCNGLPRLLCPGYENWKRGSRDCPHSFRDWDDCPVCNH